MWFVGDVAKIVGVPPAGYKIERKHIFCFSINFNFLDVISFNFLVFKNSNIYASSIPPICFFLHFISVRLIRTLTVPPTPGPQSANSRMRAAASAMAPPPTPSAYRTPSAAAARTPSAAAARTPSAAARTPSAAAARAPPAAAAARTPSAGAARTPSAAAARTPSVVMPPPAAPRAPTGRSPVREVERVESDAWLFAG